MSLKSRLRRLDAGVRWLEREGVFVRAELARKLVERLQDMSDHAAAHPEAAAQWKKIRHLLPPPCATARPAPKPAVRSVPPPDVAPTRARQSVDTVVPAAPLKESAPVATRQPAPGPVPVPVPVPVPAREPAPPEIMPGQPVAPPPPYMQIRPTRWRTPTPDDDDRPGTNGRCITEYDPLASPYDDDD